MLQLVLTVIIFMIIVIPIGNYLYHIASGQRTFADPVFDRVDGGIFKVCGIHPDKGMNWKQYALALLLTNAVMVFVGYLVLRIQFLPIFNPNGIGAMEETLSFNTIISFMTNTNLQHYSGESGLSYLSQMLVITYMMFVSAATGYAACIAFVRGLAGKSKDNVGNFYADLVKVTTRVLIPLSIIGGMLLIWQGVPQNFDPNVTVTTIEGTQQDIAMGPVAALEIIKHIGTNGGGFLGANSSTPIENPTIISDLVELYSMMILPGACVIMFGKMVKDRRRKTASSSEHSATTQDLVKTSELVSKPSFTAKLYGSEGRTIFFAMGIIFLIGLSVCYWSESQGNPALAKLGLDQSMGSMEGKEVRFGIAQSAMFTTTTTSFTTGTVNNMHDTLTPLGGMIPLLHMMLNVVFGGKGVGLMNMIMYAILGVFIFGLMIGRTPEYLGKKIEGREMKLTALCIIIHPFLILAFSALAVSTEGGLAGITNPGFHGLSQVLYEYASSAANNGSGFEGLADNSYFWNITAGLAMFFGRYLSIVIQLAIAGSLMRKQFVNDSIGTLRTDSATFTIGLVCVVYIFAALTFFPALALGPIAEHLTLWA
ncbi:MULTISPECIES: potassium-transporting ATPase subunit KdpA [Eubacteriales]|uniref:potassium-transporting ATPase subunit KdpA n=1 Tax=Eubacteriales TaxID=186802 RepID=UPI00067EFA9B|nr:MULTISPECIES: potassium-transporting ATPase subunit KdpA [Eubacteriales]MBP8858643.1 potassium-transporting ATPase subunit KdpA [Lawsonibacter sp.]MBS5505099.1 potassium-transporting ATPase subunit KdpA [Oscillospiraceae bacterium]MCB5924680.1 potassium-transporting ATPase subunit KdpA [bacterium 210820-DFI.5.26]MCQ5159480.1 potassium-transporting ATPase subunit KdpA [Clostridium sp. DFI.5.61]UMM45858.1 potassium-transporting ATPase subunit KdpA [Lawsonibacter asaccharolyticus]